MDFVKNSYVPSKIVMCLVHTIKKQFIHHIPCPATPSSGSKYKTHVSLRLHEVFHIPSVSNKFISIGLSDKRSAHNLHWIGKVSGDGWVQGSLGDGGAFIASYVSLLGDIPNLFHPPFYFIIFFFFFSLSFFRIITRRSNFYLGVVLSFTRCSLINSFGRFT